MLYIGTLLAALAVAGVLLLMMKILFNDRQQATKTLKKMDEVYEKLEEEGMDKKDA